MPVYRYKQSGLDIQKVKDQVPAADASSVSGSTTAADLFWDITAPTTSKDDLDAYMASVGWTFVETDPSDTPAQASAAEFGKKWGYEEDTGESSASNSTWVQKVRLSVSSLPEGDYLLMFAMIAYSSANSVVVGMRIEADDTTVLCSTLVKPGQTEAEVPCMQFARLSSISGSHTYDLEFNLSGGSGTAYVRQARIAIYRVA
jgi:hypothetical protein